MIFKHLLTVAAVVGGVFGTAAQAADLAVPNGFEKPFAVLAGDVPLDTQDAGGFGHASPFLVDLDADGKRDLVVGSISGKFHFYKNIGSDAAPKFAKEAGALMMEDQPARIENWCCMAVGPQFVDLDGDGVLDLTAGSYGGPSYWFKGQGGTQFKLPHQLLGFHGTTLLAHPETFAKRDANGMPDGIVDSYAANIAWAKWNDDEYPDLLLGNHLGELLVWRSLGARPDSYYGPRNLPLFSRFRLQPKRGVTNEILIDGKKVLDEGDYHSAPAVADWDGDGLWDILLGAKSGAVYWLRNTGKPGAPQFKTREKLLDPGSTYYWLEADEQPGRGVRTHVHAADYNLDGKLDLLVGTWCIIQRPRADLSTAERRKMQSVRKELEALDKEANYNPEYVSRNKWYVYVAPDKERTAKLYERAKVLEKELSTYVVKYGSEDYMWSYQGYTGQVWVFLRK